MRPVISPAEANRLDAQSSVPVDTLMNHAGYHVARVAARLGATYGSKVVVLCGKGNNGGDGLVAARYLRRRGAHVSVMMLAPPDADSPTERALRLAEAEGLTVTTWQPSGDHRPDLVIDAVFGTGFTGRLPDEVAEWTRLDVPVVAVDIASGIDASTGTVDPEGEAFTAVATVTFHALKPGHVLEEGPDRSGDVEVVDIGLEGGTPILRVCEDADAPRPARPRHAHKWSVGSVVVVGGSPGLTGAAILSAHSALAGGAGAVTVLVPGELEFVAAQHPDVMHRGIGPRDYFHTEDADAVLEAAERFDVMLLGPGLGAGTGRFVHQLILRWPGKLVLDADAINALEGTGPLSARQSPTALTPHRGEFERLTGESPALDKVAELVRATGSTVLLKGNPTLVVDADTWVVTTGGPELATIGTGDVLGGFVAALWARGLDADTSARSAAHWHGRAGAALAAHRTVTASALVDEIARYAR